MKKRFQSLLMLGLFITISFTYSISTGQGDPLPENLQTITVENADQLIQLARLGQGNIQGLTWTPDGRLSVGTTMGIWQYEANEFETEPQLFGGIDRLDVTSLAYSPDGTLLATGSNSLVRLWDAQTGGLLALISGQISPVHNIAFSPDGRKLVSGSELGRAVQIVDIQSVLNAASGTSEACTVTAIIAGNLRSAPGTQASRVGTLSAGQSTVVIGQARDSEGFTWWRLESENPPLYLPAWWVRSDLVTPAGDCDHVPILIKAAQEENSGYAYFANIAISPDSTLVASANYGGDTQTIRLWDIETGELRRQLSTQFPVFTFNGIASAIADSLAFSPDGSILVAVGRHASGQGETIRLWDIVSGEERAIEFEGRLSIWNIALSPDSKTLAMGMSRYGNPGQSDSVVMLWDMENDAEQAVLRGHEALVDQLAFSPDGNWLATGSYDGTVRVWNVEAENEQTTLEGFGQGRNAVNLNHGLIAFSRETVEAVVLRDLNTGEDRTLGTFDQIRGLVFSDNGSLLAIFDRENLSWWDTSTRRKAGEFAFDPSQGYLPNYVMAFNPDATLLVFADEQSNIRLWNLETNQNAAFIASNSGSEINSLAFSPDGTLLAYDAGRGRVGLWDVVNQQLLRTLRVGDNLPAADILAFSPDGTLLAIDIGCQIYLWDVETNTQRYMIENVCNTYSLTFSPDGSLLVYGIWPITIPESIHIVDAATGMEIAHLLGHTRAVDEITFNQDGTVLASASGGEGTVRFWGIPSP